MDGRPLFPGIDDTTLESLYLFKDVDLAQVRGWLDLCETRHFQQGELLLSPDQPSSALIILLVGRATVHVGDSNSAPIAVVREGESVGEMSLLDGEPPSAYVKADSDIEALLIPGHALSAMIDDSQGLARNLIYLLSSRLRTGNKTMNNSRKLQQKYEKRANLDVLTGLYNRRWIDNYFQRLFSSNKDKRVLSVLLIDVDDFKIFNDTHGHLAGDYALQSVAEVLRESIRPADSVARYGGEEFLVILPDTHLDVAGQVAQRICDNVFSEILEYEGQSVPSISVSAGGAELLASDDFTSLLEAADDALYEAKAAGKNCMRLAQRAQP